MAEESKSLVRRRVRSSRSAAIAGILFALMRIISLLLISTVSGPTEFSLEWLEYLTGNSSLVVLLVVFSGIAFLWFTVFRRAVIVGTIPFPRLGINNQCLHINFKLPPHP